MSKKKNTSIWKRTLKFEEFAEIPKLPNNTSDVKKEYEIYYTSRRYFILKKSLKRAIGKEEDYTTSFKKKKEEFNKFCENYKLSNTLW